MTETRTPYEALLARAGGMWGLVHTGLPVTVFALINAVSGLVPAIVASVGAAAVVLVWQLARRQPTRPTLLGFVGIAACGGFAFVTGRAKDFYLPGIWMYLVVAIVFTVSLLVRWPLVGVGWAWLTGRGQTWQRVTRVRRAFSVVTAAVAAAAWARFLVQYYLYDTDQEGLLAVARIAMGWPVFAVNSTLAYLAIRAAIRALPRSVDADQET